MAQAARLSLRMHKELKLLLSDPPPGATFPFLSPDSDLASLSSIDAQIEGPEGTVYSKGIFKIKIQIPERYPFQPPIVTFATPIYHPNIDNGGRICLDILNLPPKGSWQPSLNISTLITSIRLLLTEPNPDDGLMCEASREYKYNRQDFDLKARSMTEKFANGGAGANRSSSQGTQSNSSSSMMESQDSEKDFKKDTSVGDQKPYGMSKKLSLESSGSIPNLGSKFGPNEMPTRPLYSFDSVNVIEDRGKRKEMTNVLEDCNLNHGKLQGTRRKLSLASSGQPQKDDDNKENIDPNCPPSFCPPQVISVTSLSSSVLQVNIDRDKQLHHRPNGSKLYQNSMKELQGSPDLCQPTDGKDEAMLLTTQPKFHAIKSQEGSSVLMSSDHKKAQAQENMTDSAKKASADTKSETSSLVGKKKLSLGLKAPSYRKRENSVPMHRSTVLQPQSPHYNTEFCSKKAWVPLQENNFDIGVLSPENFSPDKSKCQPTQVNHRHNEKKQQSDKKQNTKMGKAMKQHETEEEEQFPVSETAVVLDSEESEEEQGSSRLRLSLGRKGIGKRRAKA